MQNFYALLTEQQKRHGDELFLSFDDMTLTYSQLFEAVKRLATSLTGDFTGDAGREKPYRDHRPVGGRTVCISSDDIPFQLIAFLAVQSAGAVPLLMHPALPEPTRRNLRDTGLFCGVLSESGFTPTNCCTAAPPDAVFAVLTSGSTGLPKILCRTFGSWFDFFPEQCRMFQLCEHTRLLMHGSLSFTGNLNAILSALYCGGSVYMTKRLSPSLWRSLIESESLTHIYLVPAKLSRLAAHTKQMHTAVKMIFTGSAFLAPDTTALLRQKFPRSRICIYYGTSELSYLTYKDITLESGDPLQVGYPVPGIRISRRDGLLYADTPCHAIGYPQPFPLQDHGYLDDSGGLVLQGRKDDLINIDGNHLSLSGIEVCLHQSGYFQSVSAVHYPSDGGRVRIAVFAVSKHSETRLWEIVRRCLSPAEYPKRLILLPEIPLTSSGKPDKQMLQKML